MISEIQKQLVSERIIEEEKAKRIKRILRLHDIDMYPFSPAVISPARFFFLQEKIKVINAESQHKIVSDTEILRRLMLDELEVFHKKQLSCNKSYNLLDLPLPQFCIRTKEPIKQAYKFDIQQCFYSIYSRYGIDCRAKVNFSKDYKTVNVLAIGKGIMTKNNSQLIHDLSDDKLLRNALVGIARISKITIRDKSLKIKRQWIKTKTQNFELYALISIVLNIFFQKIKPYIYYLNIDGGFTHNIAKVLESAEELGLTLKYEQIYSLEISRIGGYKFITDTGMPYISGLHQEGLMSKDVENVVTVLNEKEVIQWLRKLQKD